MPDAMTVDTKCADCGKGVAEGEVWEVTRVLRHTDCDDPKLEKPYE